MRRRKVIVGGVGAAVVAAVVLGLQVRGRAGAPPGRYTLTADTVLDNQTGLMWQRLSSSGYTWADAVTHCDNLSLAGYSDWRLPSTKELASILDFAGYAPAIDQTAFPATPSSFFWSSSPLASTTLIRAWVVDFGIGGIDFSMVSNSNHARCVR